MHWAVISTGSGRGQQAPARLEQTFQQPARADGLRAGGGDIGGKGPVGGHHPHLVARRGGAPGRGHDRGVPIARRMNRFDVGVDACPHALFGLALQHQDDPVSGNIRHQQPLVQAISGPRSVLPPAVSGRSDHIRPIHDQHLTHPASVS